MAAALAWSRRGASRVAVVALAALVATLAVAPSMTRAQRAAAGGDEVAPTVTAQLARGQRQFVDLDYAKAIKTLTPVPNDPRATRAQRLRALELIGLSHLILGNEARARDAFERLLGIDPGYQLRDDSGSPKIRAFFDQVKRQVVPGFDPSLTAELEHTAPGGARGGKKVELEVRVAGGRGDVKEMQIFWRPQGELDYRAQPARQVDADAGRWRGAVRAPAAERDYSLDYYVEARDIGGRAIGRIAGPETPLSLRVAAGLAGATPWYGRWYVWAGAAAAVVGGTVAAIALTGDDAPAGTLDPGTVVLSP